MWAKRTGASRAQAWGSNLTMKNAPANRCHATRKTWVARVLSNTRPNAEDRLIRLFFGALVREAAKISSRAPLRLTNGMEWV